MYNNVYYTLIIGITSIVNNPIVDSNTIDKMLHKMFDSYT